MGNIPIIGSGQAHPQTTQISSDQAVGIVLQEFYKSFDRMLVIQIMRKLCTLDQSKEILQHSFDISTTHIEPLLKTFQVQNMTFYLGLKKILNQQFDAIVRLVSSFYDPIPVEAEHVESEQESDTENK